MFKLLRSPLHYDLSLRSTEPIKDYGRGNRASARMLTTMRRGGPDSKPITGSSIRLRRSVDNPRRTFFCSAGMADLEHEQLWFLAYANGWRMCSRSCDKPLRPNAARKPQERLLCNRDLFCELCAIAICKVSCIDRDTAHRFKLVSAGWRLERSAKKSEVARVSVIAIFDIQGKIASLARSRIGKALFMPLLCACTEVSVDAPKTAINARIDMDKSRS